jgi:sigma-B regulation protein RsbU (phosphoserine phosphatase)
LLALVDPEARTICLASAGHCPPLILRAGEDRAEEVHAESGLPLGVAENVEFTCMTLEVGAEPSVLLAYTDGVVEAMNNESEQFGSERMHDAFVEVAKDANPQAIVKQLRKHVTRFTAGAKQSDDITLLAARVG